MRKKSANKKTKTPEKKKKEKSPRKVKPESPRKVKPESPRKREKSPEKSDEKRGRSPTKEERAPVKKTKMRDGGCQTYGPKVDFNTHEHSAPLLPEIPEPYTETILPPVAQGGPPEKPLPPIPPRMKDWD